MGKKKSTQQKNDEIDNHPKSYGAFSDTLNNEGFINFSCYNQNDFFPPRTWYHVLNSGCQVNSPSYASIWDSCTRGFSAIHSITGGELTKRERTDYKPLHPHLLEKRGFFLVNSDDTSKKHAEIMLPAAPSDSVSFKDTKANFSPSSILIEASKDGIKRRMETIVPEGANFELWEITLQNGTSKKTSFDLFIALNWNPPIITGTVHPSETTSIPEYSKNGCFTYAVALSGSPRTAWLMPENLPSAHELSYEKFQRALETGKMTSPSSASPAEHPVAAFMLKVSLPANGTWSTRIAVGASKGLSDAAIKDAEKCRKNFLSIKGFQTARKQKESAWTSFSDKILAKTPSDEFNRFFNVWTKHQLSTTALFGSSACTIEFRERMQQVEALIPLAPEKAREILLDSIRFQMRDGRIINNIPLHDELPKSEDAALDNTLWMCNAVVRYVNETGNAAFLDEQVPFYDHRLGIFETIRNGKVYDHLMAAMHCLFDFRGKFGFCKIGGHDINRALTRTTKQGGVSAMLTMAIMRTSQLLLPIARQRSQKRDIGYLNSINVNMQSNLDNYGWNGSHYTYAYDDDGKTIGGADDTYGRIHLSAQVWALLSRTSDVAGKSEHIYKAIEALDTPLGYRSLMPSYPLGFDEKGGIRAIPPGLFENGGIELYGQGLAAFMFAERGHGTKAFQTILRYLPGTVSEDHSTRFPLQLPEFRIGTDNQHAGKELYDNFNSGIAIFRLAMERIIGIYPNDEGLLVNPSLPADWEECIIQKVWRDIKFSVKLHNPSRKDGIPVKVTANGKELPKCSSGEYIILYDSFKTFAGSDKPVCVDALIG